jgi:putative component of membrane protein insertase Oxa1/YidC/SpoIIIJ protein YidD
LQVLSQNAEELDLLRKYKHVHHHTSPWEVAKHNNSTMEIVVSGLFMFYKHFISSQDSQHCSFTPSCSVYAVETIKKQGFFIGILDTFDRLTRCNGLSPENYDHDMKQRLLIDPVTNIHHHGL